MLVRIPTSHAAVPQFQSWASFRLQFLAHAHPRRQRRWLKLSGACHPRETWADFPAPRLSLAPAGADTWDVNQWVGAVSVSLFLETNENQSIHVLHRGLVEDLSVGSGISLEQRHLDHNSQQPRIGL